MRPITSATTTPSIPLSPIPNKVRYLNVAAASSELRSELLASIERVLDSGVYILGDEVEAFEEKFAQYCQVSHAVGVGSGLDALTISLRAIDIGPGDEVLVPGHTFIATWLSVIATGATVIPVDVDPARLLLSLDAADNACTPRTAAIVPVHMYGYPAEAQPFETFAARHHLALIGDAAQAHGAVSVDQSVGSIGQAAAFSFYPAKNLGALGDAGAITTNDGTVAARARRIRNYGSETKYDFLEVGLNSRLDPLQAAVLAAKLPVLDEWNLRRAKVAERYLSELAGLSELTLPAVPPVPSRHAWYAFCVRHPERDALQRFLREREIETQIYYPVPPHLSPALAHLKIAKGSLPVAEAAALTVLGLPIGPHIGDEDVSRVVEAVHAFCAR
jgi:dTDP-3-amino-3,4,6-trideoxy-alpha-D-glucose transaminase